MYPNELFWGIDLYQLMIALGFFFALVHFRVLSDRAGFPARVQNLCIFAGLISLIGGYFFAVLFQAVYNAIASGRFVLANDTGATFYGGLIGGVLIFLCVYRVGEAIARRKGREFPRTLPHVLNIGIGGVAIAHGMGRIGCLCAGCCHGHVTEAWYGIYNAGLKAKTVPIQLFEALFLFALAAFMTWNEVRGKRRNNLGVYAVGYGVWRFVIEFFRADERGKTVVPFLSPSQLIAILLTVAGTVILIRSFRSAPREKADGDET